jgi:hypothetical protein
MRVTKKSPKSSPTRKDSDFSDDSEKASSTSSDDDDDDEADDNTKPSENSYAQLARSGSNSTPRTARSPRFRFRRRNDRIEGRTIMILVCPTHPCRIFLYLMHASDCP